MNNALLHASVCLVRLRIYLLTGQGLLELHLLLHFLLFVCQNGVLAGLVVVCNHHLLAFRKIWTCHRCPNQGAVGIAHNLTTSRVLFRWGHVHAIGAGSGVATDHELSVFVLVQDVGCIHHLCIEAGSVVDLWRIVLGRNHRVWHAFLLILVRVYMHRLSI
jgi:hypothetical protein